VIFFFGFVSFEESLLLLDFLSSTDVIADFFTVVPVFSKETGRSGVPFFLSFAIFKLARSIAEVFECFSARLLVSPPSRDFAFVFFSLGVTNFDLDFLLLATTADRVEESGFFDDDSVATISLKSFSIILVW
jgi:hypothetical protein